MVKWYNPEYLFALYFFDTKKEKCGFINAANYAYNIQNKARRSLTYFPFMFRLTTPCVREMALKYPECFDINSDYTITKKCDLSLLVSKFIVNLPNEVLNIIFNS